MKSDYCWMLLYDNLDSSHKRQSSRVSRVVKKMFDVKKTEDIFGINTSKINKNQYKFKTKLF